MSHETVYALTMMVEVLALITTLVLIAGMAHGTAMKKRKVLIAAACLHVISAAGSILAMVIEEHPGLVARFALEASMLTANVFDVFTSVAIMLYVYSDASTNQIYDLRTNGVTVALLALNGLNMLACLSNPWTHLYYSFDASNRYVPSPTGFVYSLFFLVQAIGMIPVIIRLKGRHGIVMTVRLVLCGLLVTMGLTLGVHFRIMSLDSFTVSLVLMLLAVGVQTQLENDLAEARTDAAESRIRLLSGQIHPHFIFNSLSAIKGLVSEDSELAEQTIQDFSDYLRSHLDEMSSSRLVPFMEEMGHVRHYVSLEMADMSCPMEVTYDLEVTDFLLPPLTVQPLVENAIRHGIRTHEKGGTVRVSTRRSDGLIQVIVRDEGQGPSSVTDRQHHRRQVGTENVRERIERQCDGTLEVTSGPGGTTATITLPESETP